MRLTRSANHRRCRASPFRRSEIQPPFLGGPETPKRFKERLQPPSSAHRRLTPLSLACPPGLGGTRPLFCRACAPYIPAMRAVPEIEVEKLPEAERSSATVIAFQVQNLERALECFAADLRLFDFCAQHESAAAIRAFDDAVAAATGRRKDAGAEAPAFRWPLTPGQSLFIACRDATLALWNFMQAAKAIRSNLNGTPSLCARVDIKAIDDALARFHREFPDTKPLMDAVRHQAELTKTPSTLRANHREDGDLWTDNLAGRTFLTTAFGGDMVSFELSATSLAMLEAIAAHIFGAFPSSAGPS
jgi:hypothetical protein